MHCGGRPRDHALLPNNQLSAEAGGGPSLYFPYQPPGRHANFTEILFLHLTEHKMLFRDVCWTKRLLISGRHANFTPRLCLLQVWILCKLLDKNEEKKLKLPRKANLVTNTC